MFVGRMHNVAARRGAPSRPNLGADQYVRRVLGWMDRKGTLSGCLERRYFAAAEAIADLADELSEGVETHRIHADLHLGNVLFRDGELRVLDFDDMATGPAVQDLWLALPGRGAEVERQREIFLAGYERFRTFDRSTLRQRFLEVHSELDLVQEKLQGPLILGVGSRRAEDHEGLAIFGDQGWAKGGSRTLVGG